MIRFALLVLLNALVAFAILGVEFLSIRAMAPYVGATIFTTSAVIGTVVLFLSFGYLLTTVNPLKTPSSILPLAAAGLAMLLSPWLQVVMKPFLVWHYGGPLTGQFIGSVLLILIAMVSPVVALGYVTPLVMEQVLSAAPARRSGVVWYCVSGAFGGFLGSTVPALLAVPRIGAGASFVGIGSLLLLVSVLESRLRWWRKIIFMLLLAAGALCWGYLIQDRILRTRTSLFAEETAYQTVFVEKGPGGQLQLRTNMRVGHQSVYPDPIQLGSAFHSAALLPVQRAVSLGKDKFNLAVLGSAGATTATLANQEFAHQIELSVLNVDIDPVMHELAKRYFAADVSTSEFMTADARSFVNQTTRKFDCVFVDAYANEMYVPNELASTEFFLSAKQRLAEEGILEMNVVSNSDGELLKMLVGAIQNAFENVLSIELPSGRHSGLKNTFIYASSSALDFSSILSHPAMTQSVQKRMVELLALGTVPPNLKQWARSDDDVFAEGSIWRSFWTFRAR